MREGVSSHTHCISDTDGLDVFCAFKAISKGMKWS